MNVQTNHRLLSIKVSIPAEGAFINTMVGTTTMYATFLQFVRTKYGLKPHQLIPQCKLDDELASIRARIEADFLDNADYFQWMRKPCRRQIETGRH